MPEKSIQKTIDKTDFSRRIKTFNRRWNVVINDDVVFAHFKNRVLYSLDNVLGSFILKHPGFANRFAFYAGLAPIFPVTGTTIEKIYSEAMAFEDHMIYFYFKNSQNLSQLAFAIQTMIWVLEENNHEALMSDKLEKLNSFIVEIEQAINISKGISIILVKGKNGAILLPAGAKLLDEVAVNDPLLWLDDYPKAKKPFENALVFYQAKNPDWQRNLLDNLRLAIEQLLRIIFENRKSLENQEPILLAWLKDRGVHQGVINLYIQLVFGPYRVYQDDAVKHGDESSPAEVEFMIYLTGVFMRMLIQLDRSAS
jgi:hypothetical protein